MVERCYQCIEFFDAELIVLIGTIERDRGSRAVDH